MSCLNNAQAEAFLGVFNVPLEIDDADLIASALESTDVWIPSVQSDTSTSLPVVFLNLTNTEFIHSNYSDSSFDIHPRPTITTLASNFSEFYSGISYLDHTIQLTARVIELSDEAVPCALPLRTLRSPQQSATHYQKATDIQLPTFVKKRYVNPPH